MFCSYCWSPQILGISLIFLLPDQRIPSLVSPLYAPTEWVWCQGYVLVCFCLLLLVGRSDSILETSTTFQSLCSHLCVKFCWSIVLPFCDIRFFLDSCILSSSISSQSVTGSLVTSLRFIPLSYRRSDSSARAEFVSISLVLLYIV